MAFSKFKRSHIESTFTALVTKPFVHAIALGADPTISEITPFDPENPRPDSGHGSSADKQNESSTLKGKCDSNPCPETGHGAVSRKPPDPCPENGQSRVQNLDTNPVREPLREPVKEEEDAQAREGLSDLFFGDLLRTLGFDPDGALPAWWQGPSAKTHAQRWHGDLGLTEIQIIKVAEETRLEHPAPPDGPKALDRFMERAARRDTQSTSLGDRFGKSKRLRKQVKKTRPCIDELAAFYAKLVNSDRYLPASMIGNVMRDAMLAKGLVTSEQLRLRGVL